MKKSLFCLLLLAGCFSLYSQDLGYPTPGFVLPRWNVSLAAVRSEAEDAGAEVCVSEEQFLLIRLDDVFQGDSLYPDITGFICYFASADGKLKKVSVLRSYFTPEPVQPYFSALAKDYDQAYPDGDFASPEYNSMEKHWNGGKIRFYLTLKGPFFSPFPFTEMTFVSPDISPRDDETMNQRSLMVQECSLRFRDYRKGEIRRPGSGE